MRGRLNRTTEAESLTLVSAATVLPSPPTQWATVPPTWAPTYADNVTYNVGVMPGFDLAVWATSTVTLTGAHLLGALAHPVTFSPQTAGAVNDAQDSINFPAHGFLSGDGPVRLISTLTLPTGLDSSTDYWLIRVDNDNLRFAKATDIVGEPTRKTPGIYNALVGNFIVFSGTGSGVITLTDTAASQRIVWHDYGKIEVTDSITLAAREGYVVRCNHHPTVLAYGIKGTLGAAVPTSVSIYPVEAR